MRLFYSLSLRLALVYVVLFALSLCALIALNYWLAVDRPLAAIEAKVQAEADDLADSYIVDGDRVLIDRLRARETKDAPRKAYHAFLAADGTVVTGNLPNIPAVSADGLTRIEADIYVQGDEEDHLALAYDRRFRTGARLIVGRDIEDIAQHEALLKAAVPWTLGVSGLLGIIGGVVMSLAIGRRIDAVSSTARTVISGDLSGRVPVRGTHDDFDRLGETFNLMLDRIERSMEAVQRVSDHVAHELRTPLARSQMLLERIATAHAAGDHDNVDLLLGVLTDEGARLQTIFDALLRISRIETGAHQLQLVRLNMADVVADAIELYAPAAEEKNIGVDIVVEGSPWIMGDGDMLAQGVCNLIDNAIKYAPVDGRVAVGLATAPNGQVRLSITDNGPGFDPSSEDRLIERFFRGSNIAHCEGYGLGLSLTAAVADAHGSRLEFANMAPGLRVSWTFTPRTSAS